MQQKKTVEDIMAYALKKGADQCEVLWTRSVSATTQMRQGEISDDNGAFRQGYSVRVIKDQVPGFSYGTLIDRDMLRRSVDDALLSCAFAEEDKDYCFTRPKAAYPMIRSKQPEKINFKQKKEILDLLAEGAKSEKQIDKVERVAVSEHTTATCILNSLGLDLCRENAFVSASAMVVAKDGVDEQTGGFFKAANSYFDLDYRNIGAHAAADGYAKLGAAPIATGELPVIFHPEAVLDLISLILPSFMGDHVLKGMSVLKGKLNQVIASPKLSLIDDALMKESVLKLPFDDEGVPCRENRLIGGGRLQRFLYNNKYGARAKKESTGNGFSASHKSLPSVGTASYYLEKGDTPFPRMIRGTERGLWVKDLMGLHMADTVTGDFSLGAGGKLIEKGEVTTGVRGIMIVGNIFDLLKDVEAVGTDFTVYGNIGAPSLKIKSLKISGK
jgi:PmbA protein